MSGLVTALVVGAALYSAGMLAGLYQTSRRQADALERIARLLEDRKGQS